MSIFTKLQILNKSVDGNMVNLLPSGIECKHKLMIDLPEIIRLANGNLYKDDERLAKRKLLVEGTGKAPDICNIPFNSILQVITGARFYAQNSVKPPAYALDESVYKDESGELSYRLVLEMITKSFVLEYDELQIQYELASKWKWLLEEV